MVVRVNTSAISSVKWTIKIGDDLMTLSFLMALADRIDEWSCWLSMTYDRLATAVIQARDLPKIARPERSQITFLKGSQSFSAPATHWARFSEVLSRYIKDGNWNRLGDSAVSALSCNSFKFMGIMKEVTRGRRSNQLNYVPSLFSYLYSLNANASNEQLILNQLLSQTREP